MNKIVKRLTKQIDKINNKITKIVAKQYKLLDRKEQLYKERHDLKQLLDIEEMKERNKHEIHNK